MPPAPLPFYIGNMEQLRCPYCGHPKAAAAPRDFAPCRFCGFKSALIDDGGPQRLLIVDREMPYLRRRLEELSEKLPGVMIIVDRRVVQDELGVIERRRNEQTIGGGPLPV